jgi:serine carboxypeptidase 1
MFWWMHFTKANVAAHTERPLIFWLQGGPGSSSTGYGNFEILGPLDLAQQERNFTWVNTHNVCRALHFFMDIILLFFHFQVLFVDNPVGTVRNYLNFSFLIFCKMALMSIS